MMEADHAERRASDSAPSQRSAVSARLNTVPPRPAVASADIGARRPAPAPPAERAEQDLSDMEIPTFIRRQMD